MKKNETIRVLIVDDEERFRVTATATLEKRGFKVKAVGSGPEALDEVKRREIDVIVLDIMMPGMDGHRVLREINRLNFNGKVIMLTAYGSMDSAREGLRDNVFAYLTKPCEVDLLADRIREAFAMGKSHLVGSSGSSAQSKNPSTN